ncbi:MAG: cytochrome c nitrite reductase small subunit [Thermodesulfobacteriota bacterium]
MATSRKPRTISFLIVSFIFIVAAAGFAAFGPPGLYQRSESPEFCGSCHVMESRYEAWFHAGAHRRVRCVDCHLPNDWVLPHLTAKVLDGGREFLAFYTGRFAEDIRLSSHAAQVLKENCLRCHAETMARVNEDRNCWECHRQLRHRLTGAVATLKP